MCNVYCAENANTIHNTLPSLTLKIDYFSSMNSFLICISGFWRIIHTNNIHIFHTSNAQTHTRTFSIFVIVLMRDGKRKSVHIALSLLHVRFRFRSGLSTVNNTNLHRIFHFKTKLRLLLVETNFEFRLPFLLSFSFKDVQWEYKPSKFTYKKKYVHMLWNHESYNKK